MPEPDELKDALAQEARARRIIEEALTDDEFMSDVREAQQLDAAGDQGEPWLQVKARLGLV